MKQQIRMLVAAGAMALLATASAAQTPVAATAPPTAAAFTLSPGDKVRITTFGEASLTGDFEVATNGVISFPLIGDIKAEGMQPDDISRAVEAKLKDGYVIDPKVSTQVLNFRPIYLLGEVNKPGEYPFTQGLTIRGAVAKADGFTYRANEKRVFLKRAGEAAEKAYPLTADFPVMPGDTIRFGERYF